MKRKQLLPHQSAWLTAHPNRSEEWLRERMRDGFDVHHVDGDSRNNDPDNLVLIEGSDHMLLHFVGRHLWRVRTNKVPRSERPKLPPKPDRAEPNYMSMSRRRRYERMGLI